jgi:hypothetical protein
MTACAGEHREPDGDAGWRPPDAQFGLLCLRCRNRLSSLLANLPSLAVWLQDNVAAGGSAGKGAKVTGSRDTPTPLRMDVLDFIGPAARLNLSETMGTTHRELNAAGQLERVQVGYPNLRVVVAEIADQVADEHDGTIPSKDDLATLCRWLHSQLDWIVTREWVGDTLASLTELAAKAERLAPREPEHRWLEPPCPSCNLKALIFTRGIGVACETRIGGCGRSWVDEEYERLILVLGTEAMEATA